MEITLIVTTNYQKAKKVFDESKRTIKGKNEYVQLIQTYPNGTWSVRKLSAVI
jgi:hypothetical protein